MKLSLGSSLTEIQVRHSLLEPGGFNLFVSDIDLTLVIKEEKDSARVLAGYQTCKKIFLNLGEPEVITATECEKLRHLESPNYLAFWSKLFQLRKIQWQLVKQEKASSLELLKIDRGLKKSKQKLKASSLQIHLSKAFSETTPLASHAIQYPHFSHYLGCWIDIEDSQRKHVLIATSTDEANGLLAVLPDYEYLGVHENEDLRKYILQREIILSQSQKRLLASQHSPVEHLEDWIQKLKEK